MALKVAFGFVAVAFTAGFSATLLFDLFWFRDPDSARSKATVLATVIAFCSATVALAVLINCLSK